MKTLDRNVRGLGKKPFAAFALLGLLGFGLDMTVNSTTNYAERRLTSVLDSSFLAASAQAAQGVMEQNSTQTTEAKARLLFKKNVSSPLHPRYWAEGLERFGRFAD